MRDKVLLVTGGTGSFGNAVVRRYLKTDIKEIRVFSRDEKKQQDMRDELPDTRVKFYLGDVREPSSLRVPMQGVDYVFHAAALKVVPSCESFPLEAVKTNVLGSDNVFTAAIEAGVSKVIALSTDKAVQPTNAMGATKMLMEKLLLTKAAQSSKTVFCMTRYGNVMGSRGSVIPKFISQILSGQDLTITNPDMTRYLMSIEEAVELVVYAFEHGSNADLYVKKVPATTMDTLASAVKDIFYADNTCRIIGPRSGEKTHECLVTAEEMQRAEDCGDYFRIPINAEYVDHQSKTGEYTSHNTKRLHLSATVDVLRQLDFVQEALCIRATQ